MEQSSRYFEQAKKVIPGGVNSPVRAFGSVGRDPLFIDHANGSIITDVDGNDYIDYVCSWGPMILGHNNEKVAKAVTDTAQKGLSFGAPCRWEVKLADLITQVTRVEMVRMVNSGTEAVMSALRLARGYTKRDKIIKFEGCYHGHSDSMLVKAGSGALTSGIPNSAGVPEGAAKDTLTATYNDLSSVEQLLEENKGQVAAIIVEPVAANMGVVLPKDGFLQGLRKLCTQEGTLLVFDEVITGFRLGIGGAQDFFDVTADIVTYGKIIGGGMPVGAYGGKREILEMVAPVGPVYQAGTLSGNPIAMAAGYTQIKQLQAHPEIYTHINILGETLAEGLRSAAKTAGISMSVNQVGSLCCGFFSDIPVDCFEAAQKSDTQKYAEYFGGMLDQGVYLAPAQFEAMFISNAHTLAQIEETIQKAEKALSSL